MGARNYADLIAWQRAMELVEAVYKVSRTFPKEELYGLTAQLRKAAISIPSNIAEGQGRNSTKEFIYHLSVAHGSVREVETQLMIAKRLHYIEGQELQPLLELAAQIGRLVTGLCNMLRKR